MGLHSDAGRLYLAGVFHHTLPGRHTSRLIRYAEYPKGKQKDVNSIEIGGAFVAFDEKS